MANGENLGSINYSVDVDYSALIAAGQAQDQFTQKARDTASEMTKYKYVTSTVTKEYRALKASIDPAYKAQQQFAAGADLIQKELNSGRITLSQYSKDMANLRATTRATAQVGGMFRSSIGGVGTIAQQAGYQIGDFATQVASGQSAMMAFTQQAPQFAGAFGPGGAVLGAVIAIGGAVAGGLVRSFSEGSDEAKTLAERIQDVADSVDTLTEAQVRALRADFFAGNQERLQGIISERERIRELNEQIAENERLMQSAPGQRGGGTGSGILGTDVQGLRNQTMTTEELEQANRDLRKELDATQASIDTYFSEADKLNKELDDFISGSDDARKAEERRAEQLAAMVVATEAQADTIGMTERQIALYEARLLGAGRVEIAAINRAYDAIEAEEARQEALRETATLQGELDRLLGQSDPLAKFAANWEKVQQGLARGLIDEDQAEMIMDNLIDVGQDAGKKAAEEFSDKSLESAFDNLIAGDWENIGRLIGGQIGTSLVSDLGRYLNKNFGDVFEEVAKDGGGMNLKAALGGLGSVIGTAMASPIAAPIAGAIVTELGSKLFGFDDWDPTAERQASQGTGTVLGSIDAKSESIANAVDISANASRELVGINREMLRALQAVQLGIQGASARVARGQRSVDLPGVSVNENFFDNFGVAGAAFTGYFDAIGSIFTLGLFDSLGSSIGKLLGGKSRQVDEGVQIIGGYITDLVDETIVNAYATFRVKKNIFSSTKTKERFQRIGGDVEQQFSLVFESLLDSVVAGADVLGVDAMGRLAGFRVQTQRLSLEGLSAEQQTAELEAYFGTVFDQLAGAAIPFLDDFQRAGEGLGETLARVATQVQVTEQAVDMLGLRFSTLAGAELIEASDRLIELNGGLDQFISSMQNFIGNFATEAKQFEINANALAQGMGDLPLPQTREGFWALMQAQDAATKEGAENIATLLRLQGVADQYYSAMEKAQTSYYESEIQGQQQRLSEAQRANRAVQSAMDAMLFQSSAVQEASRQGAIRTLEQIANAGRVSDIGQLQSALDAATQLDQGRYSTFADYAREYARTAGVIGRVGDVTQTAEDREARMLRSLENQLEAVKGMREDLERTQLAIIKQTNKTAKTLERFEIDGIEVRQ